MYRWHCGMSEWMEMNNLYNDAFQNKNEIRINHKIPRYKDCNAIQRLLKIWFNMENKSKRIRYFCSTNVIWMQLTLPMVRLLFSKAQERKHFWKPSKPRHVCINWIALAEYSRMNTHLSDIFASFCIGQISHHQQEKFTNIYFQNNV